MLNLIIIEFASNLFLCKISRPFSLLWFEYGFIFQKQHFFFQWLKDERVGRGLKERLGGGGKQLRNSDSMLGSKEKEERGKK